MIWEIDGFQSHRPHWSIALIEADTAEEARSALLALLSDEEQRPETVWKHETNLNPESWTVQLADTPLRFVLGSGCRS